MLSQTPRQIGARSNGTGSSNILSSSNESVRTAGPVQILTDALNNRS